MCSNLRSLRTLTIELNVEETPWADYDQREFLSPEPVSDIIPPEFLESEEYTGVDWSSLTEGEALIRQWQIWEEKNYASARRCIANIMKRCGKLETIEWYTGPREWTGDCCIPEALWLWRRIKQRRKKEVPRADTTMSGDNDIDRTFIVGDLMIPGTPRESWRQFASPVVGRFSDFEGRLFSPFG